jgi:hypothetical protein
MQGAREAADAIARASNAAMSDAESSRPVVTPYPGRLAWPLAMLVLGAILRFAAYALGHRQASFTGFAHAMCVWDCTWYGDIALRGYQAYPETLNFGGPGGIANWAFFPLYPMLVGAIHRLLPLDPALLGAILSPLLTALAVTASWPLMHGDRRAYALFAAWLLAGPFSFYFATLYSESLFLLLTVLAFVALARRRFVAAGVAGALLSATRTVGVLFVFAIAIEAARELWRGRWAQVARRPDLLLALLLSPLGLFAFMVWLHVTTGDALAFVHIQRGWDRDTMNPVLALWQALTSPQGKVRESQLLGLTALAGLALCGALIARRQWAAAAFSALAIVVALANGVESMLRFVVALAPLGIVLCRLLATRRWLFWLSLLVFFALDFAWTGAWLGQRGALM